MSFNVLDIVGLFLSLIGLVVLALGLILSRKKALQVGSPQFADEKEEKNFQLEHVKDELRESSYATWGSILVIIGFVLQLLEHFI